MIKTSCGWPHTQMKSPQKQTSKSGTEWKPYTPLAHKDKTQPKAQSHTEPEHRVVCLFKDSAKCVCGGGSAEGVGGVLNSWGGGRGGRKWRKQNVNEKDEARCLTLNFLVLVVTILNSKTSSCEDSTENGSILF